MKLTAIFEVNLPEGLFLVSRPLTEELCYGTTLAAFEVQLCLNPDAKIWRRLYAKRSPTTENEPYYGMSKVHISVSRDEVDVPPKPRIQNGVTSYEDRHQYLDRRFPDYHAAAVEVLERTTLFFKYTLRNPRLHLPNPYTGDFKNPKWIWTDTKEKELRAARRNIVGVRLPELGHFGVQAFSNEHETAFKNALEKRISVELHDEFLSNAQAAIFRGNLGRGILEMAIACEIVVKQFYGLIYPNVTVEKKRVLSLIGKQARSTFGDDFKSIDPLAYRHIDFLFRARNKVAHEGRAYYRDDKSNDHMVTKPMLNDWWESVQKLQDWLNTHR